MLHFSINLASFRSMPSFLLILSQTEIFQSVLLSISNTKQMPKSISKTLQNIGQGNFNVYMIRFYRRQLQLNYCTTILKNFLMTKPQLQIATLQRIHAPTGTKFRSKNQGPGGFLLHRRRSTVILRGRSAVTHWSRKF